MRRILVDGRGRPVGTPGAGATTPEAFDDTTQAIPT